jgi:hypothetical protein
VVIELGARDRYQIGNIFRKFFLRDPAPEVLARVREHEYLPAAIICHLAQYLLRGNQETDEVILQPRKLKWNTSSSSASEVA